LQTGAWKFIDTSGRYVIESQFDEVSYFKEGFAAFTVWDQAPASQHKQEISLLRSGGPMVISP
jgi:hypothetical protein